MIFTVASLLLLAAAAFAQPATHCPVSYGTRVYVADVSNACIYYDCTNGFAVARSCGPGTGVITPLDRVYSNNPCESYYGPCIRGKTPPAPQQPSYKPQQPAYQPPVPQAPSYQAPQPSAYQPPAPQPQSQTYHSSSHQESSGHRHHVYYHTPTTPEPTTTSTTTQAPVVVQVLPGFHAIGGKRAMGTFTQMQCYESCLNTTGCQSADYDVRDKTCWLHKMDTGCAPPEAKKTCVHLIVMSCNMDGHTTFAPTTPTTPTTQAPVPNIDTALRNFHVLGGAATNASTAADCLTACASDSNCKAADFNFMTNKCFLHSASTACNEPLAKDSCTHFRLAACPTQTPTHAPSPVAVLPPDYFPASRPVVETLHGQCLGGGILDSQAKTYYDCYMNCSFGGVTCIGFDFNFVSKECRIHTAVDECISTPLNIIGCTHYRFVNCSAFNQPAFVPDTTPWCVQSGVQLFGGVEDPNAGTFEVCLVTCKASAGCAGFDYDFTTGRCLKHTTQTECNPLTAVVPTTTFAHFRKTLPVGTGATTDVTCTSATLAPLTSCVTIMENQLVALLDLGSTVGVREALRGSLIAQLQALARSAEVRSLPPDVQATLNVVFDPNFINNLTTTEAQELLALYQQLIQQVQSGTPVNAAALG